MQDVLRDQLNLDDNLVCKGEYFHVRCSTHFLNLIVQAGLEVINPALCKIRETAKYFKGSLSRRIALADFVDGVEDVALSIDVKNRWNSTYLMLKKALKYQCGLKRYKLGDKHYKHCPSNEEWRRASIIFELLKPFYSITTLMYGRSYSTSNLYFAHVWKIQCLLEVHKSNEDIVIQTMISSMREKFDKYWEEYSVILAMGAVLDPRMKLKLLKRCYNELDPFTSQDKVDHLKDQLRKIFDDYRKHLSLIHVVNFTRPYSRASEQGTETENFVVLDDLFELDDIPETAKPGKLALDIYLEEPKLEMRAHPDLNVLRYWKENMHHFGALAFVSMDILSIHITTMASESSFSIGAHVIIKYKTRLIPRNVQALLCTRSWIHGFKVDGEDEDDEIVIIQEAPNQTLTTPNQDHVSTMEL